MVNADELLALKSLVLANETAKRDFKDLLSSSNQDTSSETTLSEPNLAMDDVQTDSMNRAVTSNTTNYGFLSTAVVSPITSAMPEVVHPSPPTSEPNILRSVSSKSAGWTAQYTSIWGIIDRLELALRKVEMARWEHERIQERLQFGPDHIDHAKQRMREEIFSQKTAQRSLKIWFE